MLDLSRKLVDELVLDDVTYPLNLSFDKVLKLFAMWSDDDIPDFTKGHLALQMLTGAKFEQFGIEEALEIFKQVFEEHIQLAQVTEDDVEYDLAGNVMKKVSTDTGSANRLYNIKYDGDYIFASFLQAYGIDLFEQQGRLHWKKFNALLAGLPEGTKFVEVVKIRSYEPRKGDSDEYIAEMKRLKAEYALPDD